MCDLKISAARMLTANERQSFIFTLGDKHLVAVKSGFASGYVGEGSTGLSAVFSLLQQYRVPFAAVEVNQGLLDRLDNNCLTDEDLDEVMVQVGKAQAAGTIGQDER